jgi:hypothetical protein
MYDRNVNALWNLINRVVILNFKNHQFATDPGWGESLQRIHLGRTKREDVEKIVIVKRITYFKLSTGPSG